MTTSVTITILAVDTETADALDVNTPVNELLTHINNMLQGLQKFDTVRMTEIATPAAPAANEHKMYFKADGFIYVQDSAGIEQAVTTIDIVQYQCFT